MLKDLLILVMILGKKVISGAWGIMSIDVEKNYGKLLSGIFKRLMHFNYSISDIIIIQGWTVATHDSLIRWKSKMRLGADYIGNENHFKLITPFDKRDNVIGFVGRFSVIKGILEFIKAIPLVLRVHDHVKFLLIGTGSLDDEVKEIIKNNGIEKYVDIVGFVDNINLPEYYNKLMFYEHPQEDPLLQQSDPHYLIYELTRVYRN